MQRFIKWLGNKLFAKEPEFTLGQTGIRPKPRARSGGQNDGGRQTTDTNDSGGANTANFDTRLQGRIEDGGPGKNILARSKYVREDTGTHDTLKIIDDSLIETGEEAGFDPYNTGRFDRARNWNSRSGK